MNEQPRPSREVDAQAVRVLLISGPSSAVAGLQALLRSRGCLVERVPYKGRGHPLRDAQDFDLAVLDLTGSGPDLPDIERCGASLRDSDLVVVAADQEFDSLSQALGGRAFHLVKRPREALDCLAAMEAAIRERQFRLENRALRARLENVEERKASERLANFQAYHDLLTRLPNRALLDDRLGLAVAQARRDQRKLALMFLDLDGFKAVNDRLGHEVGDRLLKAVAERLQGCVRRSDTLGRFGGDEFALLLPNVRAREDAAVIAGKILGSLGEPFLIGGRRLSVGASIGIAMYPEAGESGETLIRNADTAMYHVKGQGKNAYRFYSDVLDREHPGQLATERELHSGLIRGEIEICWRPQVSLATGRVSGVEASWRWQHPERGLLEPADIVPKLATDGYFPEVDDFVHKQAFRQVAEWRRVVRAGLRVAVSLPAARLGQQGFVEHFTGNTRAAGLDLSAVTIQIDESTLMESAEAIGPEIRRLQNQGVRIVASDFGSGFSSLRYLERVAVAGLRLSPSLVRDLRPAGVDGRLSAPPLGTPTATSSSPPLETPTAPSLGTPTPPQTSPSSPPLGTPTAPSLGTPTPPQTSPSSPPLGTPTAPSLGTPTPPQTSPSLGTPTESATKSAERIVAAIAAAAEVLGLELIVAGVETREQLGFLKSCGARTAEGPIFSGALPAIEVENLLHDDRFAPLVGV